MDKTDIDQSSNSKEFYLVLLFRRKIIDFGAKARKRLKENKVQGRFGNKH